MSWSAPRSRKSFLITWLLSLFLGFLGLDRLYLGKIGTAVLKFVTCGGLGVWYLIDLILVLVGRQTDRHGCFVTASTAARVVAAVITVVLLFGGGTGATVTYDASPAPGVVEVTAVS